MTISDAALFDTIMDAAADAIIVSDGDGRILRANDAAGRLFGWPVDEMLSRDVSVLMPGGLAQSHSGFMQHYRDTGQKRIIGTGREVEGLRKDSTVFPLHLSVGEAEGAQGPLFVAILHDLSDRKAAEDALARAQRMDAIGQMTGGIAHDFNNLLTVIMGNLELMNMRMEGGEALRPLIIDALEAAQMGADLTARLLVFARRSRLEPQAVDLRDICADATAILQRTLGSRHVLTTEYDKEVGLALIDPVQLQSVLMNLVLNARDAMPAGGRLLISLAPVVVDDVFMAQETQMAPGEYVCLTVSDDGAGMTAEAQARAFEPFFTTKAGQGGTGLGLAMVYGFVKQSGGHITLTSEVGLGTSFALYFPVIDDGPAAPAPHARPEAAFRPDLAGRTVLIVEDNPRVLRITEERLRDLGCRTRTANSGDAALALLQAGAEIDVLFSDLVMPGRLNGYDLATLVERNFPHIRVLLTSGYASDVIAAQLTPERARDVMHKPYRLAELAGRLHQLLAEG